MTLADWLTAWRAKGYWCQCCPACGWWYAQRRSAKGRRSYICGKQRCSLWRKYQTAHGRAAPAWMVERWRAAYGDGPRVDNPKPHEEPTWRESA